MNQEQIQAFYDKYFYYILVGGVVIGMLFGLVPLVLAIKRQRRNLGLIALASCALVGGFAPIFSIIVAAAFTCWIFFSTRQPTEVIVTNEEPINVNVGSRDEH